LKDMRHYRLRSRFRHNSVALHTALPWARRTGKRTGELRLPFDPEVRFGAFPKQVAVYLVSHGRQGKYEMVYFLSFQASLERDLVE
jgi:hypothetical protein